MARCLDLGQLCTFSGRPPRHADVIARFFGDAVVLVQGIGAKAEVGGQNRHDPEPGLVGIGHVPCQEGLFVEDDLWQRPAVCVVEDGVFGDVEETCSVGGALCVCLCSPDWLEAGGMLVEDMSSKVSCDRG